MAEGRVEDLYRTIKRMAVGFEIRPGDRINEVALARDLGTSRTPLREALNRLVAERLIEARPGAGFFARALEPKAIFDLYEVRLTLETAAVRLAAERADDPALADLRATHEAAQRALAGATVGEATRGDEAFHAGIARLSGNAALLDHLTAVNERIRLVRWVDMAARVRQTKGEHRAILDALQRRDADCAARIMTDHIARRLDQIVDAVREGISSLYLDGPDALFDRPLEEN